MRNGQRAHVERLVVDAHALGLLDALAAVRALHRVLDVHELRTTTGGAPPAALTRRSRGTHAALTRRSRGAHAARAWPTRWPVKAARGARAGEPCKRMGWAEWAQQWRGRGRDGPVDACDGMDGYRAA